jgi:predicted anti-sigma-YlaC factor YlaD
MFMSTTDRHLNLVPMIEAPGEARPQAQTETQTETQTEATSQGSPGTNLEAERRAERRAETFLNMTLLGASESTELDPRCEAIQELWSSALDGETGPQDRATLDAVEVHMAHCPRCVVLVPSAQHFRRIRVRSAEASLSDLRPAIRAAIAKDTLELSPQTPSQPNAVRGQGRRHLMAPSISIALMIAGVAQGLGALPDLFGFANVGISSGTVTGIEHLTREAAASEIALAAGFVYVALKPTALSAVRMIATVLTALVLISTLLSSSGGSSGLPLEAHHLIALFGTSLLWLLPLGSHSPFNVFHSPSKNAHQWFSLPK